MKINRLNTIILPSQKRVLIRPFIPGDEEKTKSIMSRVLTLSEKQVKLILKQTIDDFAKRHMNTESVLLKNFNRVKNQIVIETPLSEERKLLIGAYFTQEYSLESAAIFNPSIVPHPDQSNVKENELRIIMSLRAVGEGHISSIVFREGIIRSDFQIEINNPAPFVIEPDIIANPTFNKELFINKLYELNVWNNDSQSIIQNLKNEFQLNDLLEKIDSFNRTSYPLHRNSNTIESIKTLAYSNYEVLFNENLTTSEKVLFPYLPSQKNGIEDARFVLFNDDDGSKKYVATYTAYDGKIIIPQLLETEDFVHFKFCTLNGSGVENKGMALFPKKIDGLYTMLSRQDNENIYIMYSDNLHFWYDPVKIVKPSFPWEFVQLGNCGSPIEVDEGWLVLSHGVGPMRKYCIGAFLLDKKDPSKIISRLKHPLLQPNENERKGYVPNVVYTCGAINHRGKLILPYSMSDYSTTFAVCEINDILEEME